MQGFSSVRIRVTKDDGIFWKLELAVLGGTELFITHTDTQTSLTIAKLTKAEHGN